MPRAWSACLRSRLSNLLVPTMSHSRWKLSRRTPASLHHRSPPSASLVCRRTCLVGNCPAKAHHHVERAPCAPLLGVALSAIGELGKVGQRVALPGAAALTWLAHKAGAHVSQVEQRYGHGQQRVGPILAQSAHPRQRLVQGITGHDDVVANPLPGPFPFFQGAHQSMASSVQYARPALLAGQRLGLTPVHTLVRPTAGSGRFGALSVWACVYCWHVPRR